jgi:hypothetical protein
MATALLTVVSDGEGKEGYEEETKAEKEEQTRGCRVYIYTYILDYYVALRAECECGNHRLFIACSSISRP